MAHGRYFREDFDRGREFIAVRQFSFNGKGYLPGQSIDKAAFSVRRLRQLYDHRSIRYAPLGATARLNGRSGELLVEPERSRDTSRSQPQTGVVRRRLQAAS